MDTILLQMEALVQERSKQMIDKILERLSVESEKWLNVWNDASKEGIIDNYADGMNDAFDEAIQIVQEVAKDGGWIACSERLPEEQDEYLVWWTADGFKGKCFYEIVEYSPEEGWIGKIPQAPFGKYTVIAWQALAPYQKGE